MCTLLPMFLTAFYVFTTILLLPVVTAPATTPAPPSASTLASAASAAPAGGASGGSCTYQPFPTATNCEVVKATIKVAAGATFDGKNKCYTADPSLGDGGQGEHQKPIFELADGATLENVVLGKDGADGVHCMGSCNITNVWWTDVGEDAATFEGGVGTKVVVKGGGAANASDKVFQHNGCGTADIECFQCKTCGKVYRSCGNCKKQCKRDVSLTGVKITDPTADVVAINPNYGDVATIKDLTVVGGTKKPICLKTEGNDTEAEPKHLGDGPDGKNCVYTAADVKTA
uniref:Probable pectate lyase F n=1 Tax=Ditylenchus dipsaci TaxID=166011 RepID=A0A915DYB2_9BILA